MRLLLCTALPLLLSPMAAPLDAQWIPTLPVSVEVRAGAGVPVGDFSDVQSGVEAGAGPAASAGLVYHLSERFGVFAAYEWATFSCSRCAEFGLDDELVDRGAGFGLEAALDLGLLEPWLRAGGLYHTLRFSGLGGELDSESGFGFMAGAGAALGLPAVLRLTPGLFYRSYPAELDLGGLPARTLDVTHLRADVGLAYRF